MESNLNLGERIKKLRTQKGLTQARLAELIESDNTLISRYENKGIQPSGDVLSKIAKALNVSIEYLLNGDPSTDCHDEEFDELLANSKKLPIEKKAVVRAVLKAILLQNDLEGRLINR